MLPYHHPDQIIGDDESENRSNKSGKSVSIQKALSRHKIEEENPVEPTNQHMVVPIFEEANL